MVCTVLILGPLDFCDTPIYQLGDKDDGDLEVAKEVKQQEIYDDERSKNQVHKPCEDKSAFQSDVSCKVNCLVPICK